MAKFIFTTDNKYSKTLPMLKKALAILFPAFVYAYALPAQNFNLTPNGDGINDVCSPFSICEIRNQEGDVVYTGFPFWDGVADGDLDVSPSGTYFYRIENADGTIKKGKIILKKREED